jgi:multicomponent Na+:H+ antiporter subunit C
VALPYRRLRSRDQQEPDSPGGLPVAQSATDVLLLEIGYRAGGHAPVFVNLPAHPGPAVDAVMQALALTDVVVGAAVTALLLALVVQVHKRAGTVDPDQLRATRD